MLPQAGNRMRAVPGTLWLAVGRVAFAMEERRERADDVEFVRVRRVDVEEGK